MLIFGFTFKKALILLYLQIRNVRTIRNHPVDVPTASILGIYTVVFNLCNFTCEFPRECLFGPFVLQNSPMYWRTGPRG